MTPSTSGRSHCQQTRPKPKTRIAGSHAPRSARDPARRTDRAGRGDGAHSGEPPSTECNSSRTSVTSSKKRGSSRVATPRGCWQVDRDDPGDPAGPRRHHDDARREEDRLGDRVRHEDDGRARLGPDPEQLEIEALARHLVERAERLVHQQERGRERERASNRDALLHPARELPRIVALEAGQLDELDHLGDPRVPLRLVPLEAARAAARCSWPRCASRRAPRPGRRSRSRGRGGRAEPACR